MVQLFAHVMYDFVKITIIQKGFAADLKGNNLLEFTTNVNVKTGEISEIYTAEYRNLKFIVYPSQRVEIKGSLHKYWNRGQHNYNDFSIEDIRKTINDLQSKFKINPLVASIHNLEIGLNINTPFDPNIFLKNLVVFKNTPFDNMRVKGQGKGKEVYMTQYGIKIYNKGLQYGTKEFILRYEKKITTMDSLKRGKIFLSDLTNPEFANHCLKQLLESYEELIVTEKLSEGLLSKPQKRIFELGLRKGSWETMSRKQRHRNKIMFNAIIQQYGTLNLKSKVMDLLQSKGAELLITCVESGNVLTTLQTNKRKRFDHSIIETECTPQPLFTKIDNMRYCKTCKRDISRQSERSIYCSEKFFGKGAKKCRNIDSNPRNKFKVRMKKVVARGLLFDILPFIKSFNLIIPAI